jgi:hypothetical protein
MKTDEISKEHAPTEYNNFEISCPFCNHNFEEIKVPKGLGMWGKTFDCEGCGQKVHTMYAEGKLEVSMETLPVGETAETQEYEPIEKATKALGEIGKPAIEPLIRALNDEDAYVRKGTAKTIETIGEPAVEPLIRALKDADEDIRGGAAEALGTIGDERAVEPLTQSLNDKGYMVREHVVGALEKLDGVAKESELDRFKSQKTGDAEGSDWEFDREIVDLRPSSELRMERQAQSSIAEEDEKIARELLTLIQQDDSDRIEKIGEYLCSNGGSDRMVLVAHHVAALGGSIREMELYWDGICGWMM